MIPWRATLCWGIAWAIVDLAIAIATRAGERAPGATTSPPPDAKVSHRFVDKQVGGFVVGERPNAFGDVAKALGPARRTT